MTVIDGYQRDYQVLVAAECAASSDAEHHDVTVRYLDDRVARVLSNAEILALVGAPAPEHARQEQP